MLLAMPSSLYYSRNLHEFKKPFKISTNLPLDVRTSCWWSVYKKLSKTNMDSSEKRHFSCIGRCITIKYTTWGMYWNIAGSKKRTLFCMIIQIQNKLTSQGLTILIYNQFCFKIHGMSFDYSRSFGNILCCCRPTIKINYASGHLLHVIFLHLNHFHLHVSLQLTA